MINSMTGYGRARIDTETRSTIVEIKSVNNRFLDISIRIPRLFGYLEEKVKKYISSRGISRGKIDINVSIDVLSEEGIDITLNKAFISSYLEALNQLSSEYNLKNDITTMQIARNPEIFSIKKPVDDEDKEWQNLMPTLSQAVDNYISSRENEGKRMKDDIIEKKNNVVSLYNRIGPLAKIDVNEQFEKYKESLLLITPSTVVDENRILTECAIMADKLAIDEEIARLSSHFSQFDEILESNEPVGRKLDFLLQEINRETNTIGSKVNNTEITKIVVDMKSELEKIREQIQNIE